MPKTNLNKLSDCGLESTEMIVCDGLLIINTIFQSLKYPPFEQEKHLSFQIWEHELIHFSNINNNV